MWAGVLVTLSDTKATHPSLVDMDRSGISEEHMHENGATSVVLKIACAALPPAAQLAAVVYLAGDLPCCHSADAS